MFYQLVTEEDETEVKIFSSVSGQAAVSSTEITLKGAGGTVYGPRAAIANGFTQVTVSYST